MKNKIFINKKKWKTFTDSELEQYKEDVFQYYRSTGFPYYSTDMAWRHKEYLKLLHYDDLQVLDVDNKTIKQSMHGLSLAWSYMPHAFEIQCNKLMTVKHVFDDDVLFKKIIDKRISFGDNMSDSGIRKTLKIFSGTQCVSNFRPTSASALYKYFCVPNGIVWDMSMGYGGRLLGAHKADVYYIGTDPCTESYDALVQIKDDFDIQGELHHCGSEEYVPEKESLDFVFTSPPYFGTEKYSNEDTQSYIKYPTKDEWVNGFLKQSFSNAYIGLKSGCYMGINIANVQSFKNLEEEVIRVATEVGFTLVDTWRYALSSINQTGFKYEPIFIFKKD